MTIYIVERRSNKQPLLIEDANCFVGSSLEKAEEFIKRNKDFDVREHVWWWVVIETVVDPIPEMELFCLDLVAIYDWGGNKIEQQPRS